jgi:hypothetical protein
MAFKQKGFPKHKTTSHLKESEYIPQSQRVMNQYEPQTVMDWNDPRRKKLDHYVTEESVVNPTTESEVVQTSVNTQPVSTEYLPSASSNEPRTNVSTPTEIDTSDIDARWARKNARREYRQAARRDRQEERQDRRQSRRDARQKRKMDRIENRTERREARRARRANRKANRRGLGSKIRDLFSRGSKHPPSGAYRGTKLLRDKGFLGV